MRESIDGFSAPKRPLTEVEEEPQERDEDEYQMADDFDRAPKYTGMCALSRPDTRASSNILLTFIQDRTLPNIPSLIGASMIPRLCSGLNTILEMTSLTLDLHPIRSRNENGQTPLPHHLTVSPRA